MYGLWYKKDDSALSQKERDVEFNYNTSIQSNTLELYISNHLNTTTYKDGDNWFDFFEHSTEIKIGLLKENYNITIGNRQQALAVNFDKTLFTIKRDKHTQNFELDIHGELENPKPGQFHFGSKWQDHSWLVGIRLPHYTLQMEQYQENHHDKKITLKHNNLYWQHSLSLHKVSLNYGELPLIDSQNNYGQLSWFKNGETWHYSLKKEQAQHWWQLSLVNSYIKNRSAGVAGLLNIYGVNAALAGANWYYGLKADIKNTGIKFGRGWRAPHSFNLTSTQWQHTWQVSLNKIQPNINSKIYKSVILIGTPNLNEEEQTEIEYLYAANISWESKVKWKSIAMKLSLSQFIPLALKDNKEHVSSAEPNNSAASKKYHVGYTLGLNLAYIF